MADMNNPYDELKIFIIKNKRLPIGEWESFKAQWSPFSAKRKELITTAGSTEKYLYFVTQRVQRVVYLDNDGREATIFLPMLLHLVACWIHLCFKNLQLMLLKHLPPLLF